MPSMSSWFGHARPRRSPAWLVLCLALPACLGPQVDDAVPGGALVLPPGAEVPEAEPALAAQIADNDGVGDLVPALSAFIDGDPALYWDFGPAPDRIAPLYYLVGGDDNEPVGHPAIFEPVPGDAMYSPFWALFLLPVTEAYQGEVIPSVAAIEEAQRLGLVGAPILTNRYVNCPVVAAEVRLDPGDGGRPLAPSTAFARGQKVSLFDIHDILDLDPEPLEDDGVRVARGDIFRLRRAGDEPLSEPVRGVDMTGDGDVLDTNDLLDPPTAGSHLFRRVSVAVRLETQQLVDQSGDDRESDLADADDLFTAPGEPDVTVVVAIEAGDELFNLPWTTR